MDALPALSRPFVMQTDLVGDQFLLPAGTVTFLLTDVEGSSRLWEERPADMGAAIARHYDLLDDAIAAHGGVRPVEQGEGDSVVAAFARAGDAVRAAVQAQRALTAELPWLRVRMAVHTGEAQLRDEGNYVGRAIIRCARLRACAHGGQILLSTSAAALVADDPGDAELVDLGTVRLRDLSRPERVWQVTAPGLRSEFPPLRSLDAVPHNLPAVLTSFIGREQELATVTGLVREERLVTLTGSGGCGKTRLALHAAADLVEHHPGGTWWVDLAPVTTADAAAERVAGAVGASAAPGADTTALVVRHLRDAGRTLVVIDNAEHVLEAMAALVDAVLAACPDVHVLVTSREPLGVAGELVWRVPSLRGPAAGVAVAPERLDAYEAARLFLERARRVRPNLVVDDDTAAHVVAVCVRLDGIPLALELAAARTRTVPLDRLAARSRRRLPAPHRWGPHGPAPPADPARLDRVERRSPRRRRAGGAAPPGRVPGPVPVGGRRDGGRRRCECHGLRRARRHQPPGRQEPGPARRHHRRLPAVGDHPPVLPRPPARGR